MKGVKGSSKPLPCPSNQTLVTPPHRRAGEAAKKAVRGAETPVNRSDLTMTMVSLLHVAAAPKRTYRFRFDLSAAFTSASNRAHSWAVVVKRPIAFGLIRVDGDGRAGVSPCAAVPRKVGWGDDSGEVDGASTLTGE